MIKIVVLFRALYFISLNNHFAEAKISYHTYTTEFSRATRYQPYVIAKTCLLKPDKGPCRAEIPMYYFEPQYQNCSNFNWGGCQGNGNRFDSMPECMQTCLSRPNHPKSRPKWCTLNFDYGFCFGAINRWWFDPLWKTCKQRIYSGCGGNKNNFYNEEQCDEICRFGTGVIRATAKERSGIKRILILNSVNATTKRGREQASKREPKKIIN